ncbi:MAG: VacJ family lipoprotein [Syntrophobacteraceae bacterium]
MKTWGRYLEVGLTSFLIFTILNSPIITGKSGFNTALAAQAQTVEQEEAQNGQKVNDPYEHFNRDVFDFNDHLYFYVLKPLAKFYSAYLPTDFRESIRNGFHNLVFPSRFINFVLQGKGDYAANEVARFLINSTLGLAGLFDFAQTQFRLENHESDFGQTLARWGVGSGPFLIIPGLGPSNPRDFFGFGVDSVMDPLFWLPAAWYVSFSAESGKFINRTSLEIGRYEELKKASLDPYIAMRDAYIQYRAHISE